MRHVADDLADVRSLPGVRVSVMVLLGQAIGQRRLNLRARLHTRLNLPLAWGNRGPNAGQGVERFVAFGEREDRITLRRQVLQPFLMAEHDRAQAGDDLGLPSEVRRGSRESIGGGAGHPCGRFEPGELMLIRRIAGRLLRGSAIGPVRAPGAGVFSSWSSRRNQCWATTGGS